MHAHEKPVTKRRGMAVVYLLLPLAKMRKPGLIAAPHHAAFGHKPTFSVYSLNV
jgi:hypothetical protein